MNTDSNAAYGGGEGDPSAPVTILYTNWLGETAPRRIILGGRDEHAPAFWFGSTKWHPQPQRMFTARDADREVYRDFALSGVKAWGEEAVSAALASTARAAAGDWVTMPRHPTEAMKAALAKAVGGSWDIGHYAWEQGVAAAPAVPASAAQGKHPLDSEAEQMRLAVALTSGDHATANEIYGRAWYVDVCRAEQRLKEFVAAGKALLASLPDHWHDDATVAMRDLVEGTDIVLRPGFFTKAQQEVAFREYGAQAVVPDQSPAVPASPRSGAGEGEEPTTIQGWREKAEQHLREGLNMGILNEELPALISALSQGGQAGGSEKGAPSDPSHPPGQAVSQSIGGLIASTERPSPGELSLIERLEQMAWGLSRDHKPYAASLIREAVSALAPAPSPQGEADPAQSPNTSDGEG